MIRVSSIRMGFYLTGLYIYDRKNGDKSQFQGCQEWATVGYKHVGGPYYEADLSRNAETHTTNSFCCTLILLFAVTQKRRAWGLIFMALSHHEWRIMTAALHPSGREPQDGMHVIVEPRVYPPIAYSM